MKATSKLEKYAGQNYQKIQLRDEKITELNLKTAIETIQSGKAGQKK